MGSSSGTTLAALVRGSAPHIALWRSSLQDTILSQIPGQIRPDEVPGLEGDQDTEGQVVGWPGAPLVASLLLR